MARTTSNSGGGKSGKKANRRAPPPTPGEVLREFLLSDERVSQEALAQSLGVSRVTVNQLINGRQAVTAEMALRLAKALSTTPELWLNLQRDVDLDVASRELEHELRLVKTLRKPLKARELFYELED